MHQGFVHTFLRYRSRIFNNSLVERLLFQAWKLSLSKQASSQQNTGAFGHKSEVICCPSKVYDIFNFCIQYLKLVSQNVLDHASLPDSYPVAICEFGRKGDKIGLINSDWVRVCFFATPASSLGCVHLTLNGTQSLISTELLNLRL